MSDFIDLVRERLNEPPFILTGENSEGVPYFEVWMNYYPEVPSDRPHVIVPVEDWTLDTYETYIEYVAGLAARMNAGLEEGIETWATIIIPGSIPRTPTFDGDVLLLPVKVEQRAEAMGFEVTVWAIDEAGELSWEWDG